MIAYENACENSEGGAFLRRERLYSSQMTEWRRLRDAGVLAGKKAGESIGKLSAEQAENARLRRQLEVRPPARGPELLLLLLLLLLTALSSRTALKTGLDIITGFLALTPRD